MSPINEGELNKPFVPDKSEGGKMSKEWTIKRLRFYLGMDCHTSVHVLDVLAQEIEAQLAVERELVIHANVRRSEERQQLREELAVERQQILNRESRWNEAEAANRQLREQIAAEREKRESIESINKSLAQAVDQLHKQLDAEREAWDKQFTATMTVLGETQQQLAAERAKVKELEAAIQACTCLPMNEADCPTHTDRKIPSARIAPTPPLVTKLTVEQQLAAEREKREGAERDAQDFKLMDEQTTRENRKLEKQLAAERKQRESIESINKSLAQAVDQLRAQAQTLVDALKESREIHESMRSDLPIETLLRLSMKYHKCIDAALEKVGK